MLTVDPRRQAEGLGRALLSKAEDYVREQGAARVQMTVIALRHGLIAWYETARLSPHRQKRAFSLW